MLRSYKKKAINAYIRSFYVGDFFMNSERTGEPESLEAEIVIIGESENYCYEMTGHLLGFAINSGRIAGENAVKYISER